MYNQKTYSPLDLDQIRRAAPSVFATQSWAGVSENYRFFPTFPIVEALLKQGFECVSAGQANTRIEGKAEFTRHILKFRNPNHPAALQVGDLEPHLTLMNSHDRTSTYRMMLGLLRKACMNGMMVKHSDIMEVTVRHSGRENLIDEVIEGSYQVIEQAPKAIEQVREMSNIILFPAEQVAMAKAAIELRGSTLDIEPSHALHTRRTADASDDIGNRDLWRTLNVVQENLVRGGIRGTTATGNRRRLRAIKSVNEDTKLNRALWTLADEMKKIKQAA